jgi:RimJ/RimL family protein N-acetyltransferase
VFLRPYTSEDKDVHCEAVNETRTDLSKWFSWCDKDKEYVSEESRKFIEERAKHLGRCGKYDFAIIDCETGYLLGSCGLQVDENDGTVANISYWVRNCATGQCVATRAVKLLLCFGFESLCLSKIIFKMATCNKGSRRVAEKVGAKLVEENDILPVKNTIYEAVRYQFTREMYVEK